jgi:N4-gp56 family major capsid protein
MPTLTTSVADDSIRDLYDAEYVTGAEPERLYDQYATYRPPSDGVRLGAVIQFPSVGTLPIETDSISQTTDITPRSLGDTKVSITTTSRAGAMQVAEQVAINTYTDSTAAYVRAIGQQAAKSIEFYNATVLLNGLLVQRSAARASLDAGTAADLLTDATFVKAAARLERMGVGKLLSGGTSYWMASLPGESYADLIRGGNVVNVGIYSGNADEVILNWELGRIGNFKVLSSPAAKVFGAAGADAASNVNTTIAAPTVAGYSASNGLYIDVAANTNIAVGQKLWIGTEETSTTFDPLMEPVIVSSVASTVIGVIGSGENGGLMYDHPVGHAVRNADSVYPVLVGSPASAIKTYDAETGEFGKMLPPKYVGRVEQWTEFAWKWHGGMGIVKQNGLLRIEVASGQDA